MAGINYRELKIIVTVVGFSFDGFIALKMEYEMYAFPSSLHSRTLSPFQVCLKSTK